MVEEQRYFCHRCGGTFGLAVDATVFVCPHCSSDFVERLEAGHPFVFAASDDGEERGGEEGEGEGEGADERGGPFEGYIHAGGSESGVHFRRIPGGFVLGFGGPVMGMFPAHPTPTTVDTLDVSDLFRLVLHPESIPADHPLWQRLGFHGDPRDYVFGENAFQQALDALMHQTGHRTVGLQPEQIDDLPREIIGAEEEEEGQRTDGSRECAICQEPYKRDEETIRLSCAHRFHADCVSPWLLKVASCPICRQDPLKAVEHNDAGS